MAWVYPQVLYLQGYTIKLDIGPSEDSFACKEIKRRVKVLQHIVDVVKVIRLVSREPNKSAYDKRKKSYPLFGVSGVHGQQRKTIQVYVPAI